ncbi:hypothetical protein PGT21_003608 [Puccinia graminis f. sp. tritici]|uniref:Uncharacterized protein n=1 Tax=Puccinia graminis f. sp. tritici TaxID=56615 RepID=A0A5B0Q1Y2_PUCGR|nr:hypothetical protein PGT21_003608 [Puccinia graminis f. sp. tritici]
MTVFSTSSLEEQSFHQNSSSSSTTTTYDGNFDNPGPYDGSFRPNNDGAVSSSALPSRPLLNLQCTPKLNPYMETDDPEISSLIVDAGLTYYPVEGAIEISEKITQLQIVIINTNTSQAITAGIVTVNTLGNRFQFPLTTLGKPSTDSYQVICQAYSNDEYLAERPVSVQYLPDPRRKGMTEAVRIESESGTLMVTNDKGALQTLIPFGSVILKKKTLNLLTAWREIDS